MNAHQAAATGLSQKSLHMQCKTIRNQAILLLKKDVRKLGCIALCSFLFMLPPAPYSVVYFCSHFEVPQPLRSRVPCVIRSILERHPNASTNEIELQRETLHYGTSRMREKRAAGGVQCTSLDSGLAGAFSLLRRGRKRPNRPNHLLWNNHEDGIKRSPRQLRAAVLVFVDSVIFSCLLIAKEVLNVKSIRLERMNSSETQPASGAQKDKMALRVRPLCFDYGTINALQKASALRLLFEGTNMLSFLAFLRRKTIESGGRPGSVSWHVWHEAATDLGLSTERASIIWRCARIVEVDRQGASGLASELFADEDSVPLARLGALLFYSSVIPRPVSREVDAAWLDPPAPTTIVEDASKFLKLATSHDMQTIVIDLHGGEVAENVPIDERSISDVVALATKNMQKNLGAQGKSKIGTEGSYIATMRRVPAFIEYNSTFVIKILVISLGLSTSQGILCADMLPSWPPRSRLDSGPQQNPADGIDWSDILIPLSCMEHLRFMFELPDVPLTLGWRSVEAGNSFSEPCVKFTDAVSYLCDLKGISMGSFPIRNENLPWGHMRSIAGMRIAESLYPRRWEVSALTRSTLIKRVEQEGITDLDIRGCKECRLDFIPQISAPLLNVIVGQCADCTVFIGACASLTLTTSERITIMAATRADVRIINCFDCQVYILCNERPTVFGDNRLVYLAPAGYNFTGLEQVLKVHGIQLDRNLWKLPFDVERDGPPHPSAVALLPPSAYWPPVLAWRGAGDLRSTPWAIEQEYAEMHQRRLEIVERLRRSVCEKLTDRKEAMTRLQELVHRRFREWLGTNTCMRHVHDLLRMGNTDASVQTSCTAKNQMHSPRPQRNEEGKDS